MRSASKPLKTNSPTIFSESYMTPMHKRKQKRLRKLRGLRAKLETMDVPSEMTNPKAAQAAWQERKDVIAEIRRLEGESHDLAATEE